MCNMVWQLFRDAKMKKETPQKFEIKKRLKMTRKEWHKYAVIQTRNCTVQNDLQLARLIKRKRKVSLSLLEVRGR